MDQAWIDRETLNCDPYRKLTQEDLEEIDKVGDLTVINPPKSWKGPLSLSQLGIPNWKFLIYDALKDSIDPAWTFDKWENDFETPSNKDGLERETWVSLEDNEYVYNMICGLEYSYKNYHKKNHPFSFEYDKITDFLHRAEGKQFTIN